MSKSDPAYGTPEWYNAIGERAAARILAIAKPIAQEYTAGGYIGGYAPLDLSTLQKMPVTDAVGILTNMMRQDTSRADGVRLFAQYLGWLEQSGQISPETSKMFQRDVARQQAAGLLAGGQ